jgi:hypothetical protein
VKTAWYGMEECAHLARSASGSLVGLCDRRSGSVLRLIDPDTLRPTGSLELPGEVEPGCGSAFFLDDRDRAVVATTDRRILTVDTATGLRIDAGIELSQVVPTDDCLVALLPTWDRSGRVWFVTQEGRVGIVGETKPRILELGARVTNSFTVDQHAAYVVTVDALYRLSVDGQGRPTIDWVKPYERSTRPTLLPDDLMAITENAEPRMHVVFLRRSTGEEVCQVPVFGGGESATESSPVAVGRAGVVVENNAGYAGPQSTLLGMTTPGGLARVDLVNGRCKVAWSADVDAPSSVAEASMKTGLVYTITKRSSYAGVSAWYLSAIDAETGRVMFGVRIGLGLLANGHYSDVTLAPDGSAYAATLGGLVRVRDR